MIEGHGEKLGVVLQARMGSTRLPGKILMPFAGSTFLEFQLGRVLRASGVQDIVVATTTAASDDILVDTISTVDSRISIYRGSEKDVLERVYFAAKDAGYSLVIRLNGDCPFLDPELIDRLIDDFRSRRPQPDYMSTILGNTFPIGMHIEIMTIEALRSANEKASLDSDREHVTPYIYNEESFLVDRLNFHEDASDLRLTVDYYEDVLLMKRLAEELGERVHTVTCCELVRILRENPDLTLLNSKFYKKQSLAR